MKAVQLQKDLEESEPFLLLKLKENYQLIIDEKMKLVAEITYF